MIPTPITAAITAGVTCSNILWECIKVLWPQIILAVHKSNWLVKERKERVSMIFNIICCWISTMFVAGKS